MMGDKLLYAFLIGGAICAVAQLLIDKTRLTSARIMVFLVTLGVFLGGIGVYKKVVDFAGAGATVPLVGFGYSLAQGVMQEVDKNGLVGVLTGGIKATAGGITAAIFFGYVASLIAKPKAKR